MQAHEPANPDHRQRPTALPHILVPAERSAARWDIRSLVLAGVVLEPVQGGWAGVQDGDVSVVRAQP
jgi:hypothetical protein